jgi:hypothetical protein
MSTDPILAALDSVVEQITARLEQVESRLSSAIAALRSDVEHGADQVAEAIECSQTEVQRVAEVLRDLKGRGYDLYLDMRAAIEHVSRAGLEPIERRIDHLDGVVQSVMDVLTESQRHLMAAQNFRPPDATAPTAPKGIRIVTEIGALKPWHLALVIFAALSTAFLVFAGLKGWL